MWQPLQGNYRDPCMAVWSLLTLEDRGFGPSHSQFYGKSYLLLTDS